MDVLQAEIEKGANFELQQRRWKHTFEAHGIIVRRGKTEYNAPPLKLPKPSTLLPEMTRLTSQGSGLIVPWRRRSGETRRQHTKQFPVKSVGNNWGNVRKEHTKTI